MGRCLLQPFSPPPSRRPHARPMPWCYAYFVPRGYNARLYAIFSSAQWAVPTPAHPLRLAHCLPRGWAVAFGNLSPLRPVGGPMPGLCLGAMHTLCPGAIMPGYTPSFPPPSGRRLFRPIPCAWHTACPGDGPLLFAAFLPSAQWAAPCPARLSYKAKGFCPGEFFQPCPIFLSCPYAQRTDLPGAGLFFVALFSFFVALHVSSVLDSAGFA